VSWQGRANIFPVPGSTSHDMTVDTQISDGHRVQAGSVMVFDNVMALKGEGFKEGATSRDHWFDNAEAAVTLGFASERVMVQVLATVFPEGPGSLKASQSVDHTEDKQPLQLVTAYYARTVSPPWKVTGTVTRDGQGVVAYELAVTTYAPGHPDEGKTISYTGKMWRAASIAIPDDTSLEGWDLSKLNVVPAHTAASKADVPQAEPVYHTVGEVRAALKADADPGVPDPKRDFTGYWKTQCGSGGSDISLDIAHTGSDGMYIVSRCYKDTCASARFGKKTYITGDAHYEARGDDVITVYSSSAKSEEFHRCPGEHPLPASGNP
jgi:hypothetical protein